MRATLAMMIASVHPLAANAQSPAAGRSVRDTASDSLARTFSVRARVEGWDWFDAPSAPPSPGRYSFDGFLARGGLAQQLPRWAWRVELAAPVLLGLPEDAVAPAPAGQLGLGATYWAGSDSAEHPLALFLKQAYVRFGRAPAAGGHSLRVGRFEFSDGAETTPSQATLAALKRDRVAQRLVGPFGWSHVGRSFDGAHYAFDRKGTNVTAVLARPTEGAFQVNGWAEVDDVTLGYASGTVPIGADDGAADARAFAIWYRDARFDDRPDLLATDNRPAVVRREDREAITVTTLGAHLADVFVAKSATFDALLWGAVQGGSWGALSHRAGAFAVEGGVQPAGVPWRPWLRASWFRSTGDDDPTDDRHGTFFQLLPTPRPYARTPFFNLMNLEEVAGSVILRPTTRTTIRLDLRGLRLTEAGDLWYSGGGAFETETFGYAGRPSNGERGLGQLFDVSVDQRLNRRLTFTAYGGIVSGGSVVGGVYPASATARFGYLELEYRL